MATEPKPSIMGNMHFVTQIQPKIHKNGAVLKVMAGKESQFERDYQNFKLKDNSSLDRPKIEIRCPNVNESANTYAQESKDLYLVIRSGSKYGYQQDLRSLLDHFAPRLEDALFYIEDESRQYVEKFEIKKGRFINKLVVAEDGDLIDYYEKNFPKEKKVLFELLKLEAAELGSYSEYGWKDTISKTIRLANRALKIKKDDWQLVKIKGHAKADGEKKYDQGLKLFKKALRLKKKELLKEQEDLDTRDIYCAIAYCLNCMEKYKEAIEYCDIANKIYPHFGNQRPEEYKGYALLNMKKYEEALGLFNQLLQTASQTSFIAYALYNKACALTGLRKFDQACGFMAAALSMFPYKFNQELVKDPDMKPLLDHKHFKRLLGEEYEYVKQAKEKLDE